MTPRGSATATARRGRVRGLALGLGGGGPLLPALRGRALEPHERPAVVLDDDLSDLAQPVARAGQPVERVAQRVDAALCLVHERREAGARPAGGRGGRAAAGYRGRPFERAAGPPRARCRGQRLSGGSPP